MATDMTVRERVQQAVTEHFTLLAEREVAQDKVGQATSARNVALNSTAVVDVQESAGAVQEAVMEAIKETYDGIVVTARKPLERAQTKFDGLESQALEIYNSAVSEAEEAFQATVDAAHQEYDLELATAEAEVYRAKNEVSSLNDTLSQHRDVVSQQHGIDLNALTGMV